MDIKIGIYKITNPNGSNYIGQSTNIDHRFNQYSKLYCEGQKYLYNSLNKYGWDNHTREILEEIYDDDPISLLEKLNEREIYWSEIHNALYDKGGLNLKIGGKHGYRSQETKDKISQSGKGKHDYTKSPEFKQMLSETHSGKEYSDKSRKKMSNSKMGDNHFYHKSPRKESSNIKQALSMLKNNQPILQYDIQGNFIKEYENYSIACFDIKNQGIKIRRGDIRECCENKQLTCCGFIFQYKSNSNVAEIVKKVKNDKFRHNNKIVYQYDLEGNFMQEFPSSYKAARHYTHINSADIRMCCSGKQKTAGGFKWSHSKI